MKITKLGHCCLLIEEKGLQILTDPGAYSTKQNDVENIDIVLITHEHADHLHIESLKNVLQKSPYARVITNSSVGEILTKEGIVFEVVEHGQSITVGELILRGFGTEHAYICETAKDVQNTGYFIGDRLFYPGDAFYDPREAIDILALPVAGPWMKISEAIEYAKQVKPNVCFPVHDGMLEDNKLGPVHTHPEAALSKYGIKFVAMKEGSVEEL